MAQIKILRALPGSGKSTLVKLLEVAAVAANQFFRVFSSDDYFIDASGAYCFDPAKLPLSHASCKRQFLECLREYALDPTAMLVVDNTNLSVAEVAFYYEAAVAYGAEPEIIDITGVKLEDCVLRNVHGVSALTIGRMSEVMRRESANFPPWWTRRGINTDDIQAKRAATV